jgi:hypothetical protein
MPSIPSKCLESQESEAKFEQIHSGTIRLCVLHFMWPFIKSAEKGKVVSEPLKLLAYFILGLTNFLKLAPTSFCIGIYVCNGMRTEQKFRAVVIKREPKRGRIHFTSLHFSAASSKMEYD